MLTHPQIFTLPTMPFRRDISSGCPVGTSIKLTGKPYDDVSKSVILSLLTNNNDTALRVDLVIGQPAKIRIDCTVSQKTSTAIENYVVCPLNTQARLHIKTLQHSFEIYFNNSKIADFVHRVDPNLIKSIHITGPLITEEVVIEPAVAGPLPSYEQATSPPVEQLMSSMSISGLKNRQSVNDFPPPPPGILNPTAPPAQVTIGAGASAPPMAPTTAGTSTTSSSFFYTGGSQGFSNHPYPLPGLIDNSTHSSQPNSVGQLRNPIPEVVTSMPSAPPNTSSVSQPVGAGVMPLATGPISAGAYVSAPVNRPPPASSTMSNMYTPTPLSTPTVPYTVTFPQTASNTPAFPQPIPPQAVPAAAAPAQPHLYQNQMPLGYNPYPQYPQQVQQPPVVAPTTVIPTGAVQPYAPQVIAPQPMVAPQPYMYPTAAVQPYPMYQQYQYPYAYPEVIYYESGHHHHHGHHFFGHHHHHCD